MALEAVLGKDVVLLFRIMKDAATNAATKLAFQTEHETTETSESEAIATKDGSVNTQGTSTIEMSCTSILARNDEMLKKLRDARRKGDLVEIWEVDTQDKKENGKYGATYYRGKVSEFSKKPAVDGAVEVSLTFSIDGEGADGEATLTKEQETVVEYEFKDTTKNTAE
ncbi:phage major tail protein, TP901-1 family [Vagococcus silagei]|uniref:Phage major tail protein, TP901-1 family n=1 Tax=Vagococcus silagei TaxID=2508885 RepID=A0A4S3B6E2_9ENTE|nr:phage major tail protein, TP901-1 family [Vagococcus silagei]THB62178.1 phage major tail protein, TP901-1 family [Vagococcus silagei]